MSPWLKGCKTRFEASAERRSNTAATASRLHSATWRDARTDLTRRYDALCARYGMQPTRNNCGVAHENGVIESARGHLRAAVVDALLMRGTRDFDDLASYRRFVDEIVSRKNAHHAKRIEAERSALQRLPGQRTCDFEETVVTVTSSGGFTLRKVFYTVPSRLIGHRLRACLLDKLPERSACRMMVDLVVLARERCCEAALATALEADLSAAQLPDIATLRTCFAPDPAALPELIVHLMPLIAY